MRSNGLASSAIALALALAFSASCGAPSSPSTTPDVSPPTAAAGPRAVACTQVSGTPDERLTACLAQLGPATLSPGAKKIVDGVSQGARVLELAGKPAATPPGAAPSPVLGLADVPGARAALLGTDEEAASKALRDQHVRAVVVHRDLTQALDRDRVVLARLANHDFLEWFELRWVTSDALVYTVRASASHVPDATGQELVSGLRARLEGRTPTPQSWHPSSPISLIATIRLQGGSLAMRHAAGENLDAALDDLADKLRRRWDREVETDGVGRLADKLPDARIEVQVVTERATIDPRDEATLTDLWELGVDGAMLTGPSKHGDDGTFAYMPGSEAVTRALKTPEDFLAYTAKSADLPTRRPWEQDGWKLDLVRTDHFLEAKAGGGAVVRLFRGMPLVGMDEVTDDNLRQMLVDGGEWWLENQRKDGSFAYKYWPEQNRWSTEYNEVRHILAARDLAAAWEWRHDPRYLAGSRKAMDWLLKYEVKPEDAADPKGLPSPPKGTILFRYPHTTATKPGNQKLGTVAVALLGWIEWAKATGSHAEDQRIRQMAGFVLSMKQPNGKFEPYDVPEGHPYYGETNDIVPGEAALALGEVAQYFGEKQWLEFFPSFLDYYQPWFEERAQRKNPYGRWPQATYSDQDRLDLVQFGPWAVMACKQYYEMTGDERAAKFGLEIADWMIDTYQWSAERAPFPDYVGGYYKMPSELPAMQTFCYSEGTAAAYRIAEQFAPDRAKKYDEATRESLRFLRVMQYDDVDSYFVARPEVVHGGVKYAMNEPKIRIDYVGHALSTVAQYLDARQHDPAVAFALKPMDVKDEPVSADAGDDLPPEDVTPDDDGDDQGGGD